MVAMTSVYIWYCVNADMKIAITGHTANLGLALSEHFTNCGHTIIGMSRSNGFTLPDDLDRVAAECQQCDLFINNAHVGQAQAQLIERLAGRLPIVTLGSISSERVNPRNNYSLDKKLIQDTHQRLKRQTRMPMLLLRPGYLENYPELYPVKYREIISAIEHWLVNPRITQIDLENSPEIYGFFN